MKLTLISIKDRKEPKDAKMTQGCQVDVHVDGKDNLIPTLSNGSIVQNVKEAHTLDNATKVKFPSEVDTPISFEDDILRKGIFFILELARTNFEMLSILSSR